ncbi:MAG: hypothetical protein AAFX10_06330 [Pseudomonadota bacterium]
MTTNNRPKRDPFTLSAGATTLKSAQAFVPQVSSDQLNSAIAERLTPLPDNQPDTGDEMLSFWGRFWFRARRRAASEARVRNAA